MKKGESEMTINEYLYYPMGKGFSAMGIAEARDKMIEKFTLDEDGIKVNLYKTNSTLVFHAEIPSHSTKGLYYDTIVEFPYGKADMNKGNNIFEFPFKVYSNCPSFVYSYAYIFYQKHLICDWLVSRYDKKTLTTPPTKRNSWGIIFYEQSIFFTLYYIKKYFGMSVMELDSLAVKSSHSTIKDNVSSETNIRSTRTEIKNAIRKTKDGHSVSNKRAIVDYDKGSTANGVKKASSLKTAKSAKGTSKPKGLKGTKK